MKRTLTQAGLGIALAIGVIAAAAPSRAVTYDLVAQRATVFMPDSREVPMWGFALGAGAVTVPGPRLVVPPGDSILQINVTNNLPEAVSIIIPGQVPVLTTPTKFMDGQGRFRARSLIQEIPAGGNGTYIWNNFKPGTYLYHSGSHPAVQVQMGLYGAATKDTAANEAYGTAYDSEVLLLYSEIDPALHDAVDGGTYGGSPYPLGTADFTSTVDYRPEYFLVNGMPFNGETPMTVGKETILIRYLNAGLRSHSATFQSGWMSVIAEDGNAYPWPKEQYSVFLAAQKTKDALWTPPGNGTFSLFDRFNDLTTSGAPDGGLLKQFRTGIPDAVGYFQPLDAWFFDTTGTGIWEPGQDLQLGPFGWTGPQPTEPVAGDWNGDGVDEIGFYQGGQWFLDDGSGSWDGCGTDTCVLAGFGWPGAVPVTGDWDGDGVDNIGVYSGGIWWLDDGDLTWDGCINDICVLGGFGWPAALPVTGDWDGDNDDDIGVFADGIWWLDNGDFTWQGCGAGPPDSDICVLGGFGWPGVTPVSGDWNNDNVDDIGFFNGFWYLDNGDRTWQGCGSGPEAERCLGPFGNSPGDLPVTGRFASP